MGWRGVAMTVGWLVVATTSACAFDTEGLGSGPASSLGEATSDDTTGDGGSTSMATGSASGQSTSSSSTTGPGTSTTTTTGVPTSGVTTDADTTGADSTTGPPPPSPYPACDLLAPMHCAPDQICIDDIYGYNMCSPVGCTGHEQCPEAPTGNSLPYCTMGGNCVLDCGGGLMCPTGMDCVYIPDFQISRCLWPNP